MSELRQWTALPLAVGILCGGCETAPAERPGGSRGIVLEEVEERSALDGAGLRRGDVLLAWHRPEGPQSDQGKLTSPFDWAWLIAEQAPRGPIRLTAERDGQTRAFEVAPGNWEARVRLSMPSALLEVYSRLEERAEAGDLPAMTRLGKDLEVRTELESAPHLRCWLLLHIGEIWRQAEQWEPAHTAFREALDAAPDPIARVAVWEAIGKTYHLQRDFDQARKAHASAQEIRERNWGQGLAFARGLGELGEIAWDQGQLNEAETLWGRALAIEEPLASGSLSAAKSLARLGKVAGLRDELDRAAELFGRGLEIRQRWTPDSLVVAGSLNDLGTVARQRGELERAAEYHHRALAIRRRLAPDGPEVANSLNTLGNVAADRGDLDQAEDHYLRAMAIVERHDPDSLTVAGYLSNLGLLTIERGELDRAEDYLERALAIHLRDPDRIDPAYSLINLGILAMVRGELDRAEDRFQSVLEVLGRHAPESRGVAYALANLGTVAEDRGELERAEEYYERSLELNQRLSPGGLKVAVSLSSLGQLAAKRGRLALAAEYHQRALDIYRRLSPGTANEAFAWHALAGLSRRQGRIQLALERFRKALNAVEDQVGRLGGSGAAEFRAQFLEYYRDTIGLLLELGRPAEAFHVLERSRARSFLARLAERDLELSDVPADLDRARRRLAVGYERIQRQLAELSPEEHVSEIEALQRRLRSLREERNRIAKEIREASPRLAALAYPEPLELREARQALDPGTLLLSYSVGPEQTLLFALAPEIDLRVETLAVGEEKLRHGVKSLHGKIRMAAGGEPALQSELESLARELYAALIEPVEDLVAASERLLLIADGPLHSLPWAALVRESPADGRQYLVEWKPLHMVLSATVYAELRKRRKEGRGDKPVRLAAFGDPHYPVARNAAPAMDAVVRSVRERGVFDWRPLPHSRREVEGLAALYPAGDVRAYLGAEATEERAKSLERNVEIVHFATHGHVDERFPLSSFLALSMREDGSADRDNGLLQAWEIIEQVRLDADLVVLSACASGSGVEQAGEGLIGLTRAFQFAGARTVAATLWSVQDRATADLMVRFHRHLSRGAAKDEALRAAQVESIRGASPYYWAAFQIIGDRR